MEITTKGRYAVRVMADIAKDEKEYTAISDIAERQQISVKYLEKIIAMLSKAKLVESMRGAYGGYKLSRPSSKISVKQILDATGDNIKVATCVSEKECPQADKCDTIGVWNTLNQMINSYLESVSLEDLVQNSCERKVVKM